MFKTSDAPRANSSTSSWHWRPLPPGLFPLSLACAGRGVLGGWPQKWKRSWDTAPEIGRAQHFQLRFSQIYTWLMVTEQIESETGIQEPSLTQRNSLSTIGQLKPRLSTLLLFLQLSTQLVEPRARTWGGNFGCARSYFGEQVLSVFQQTSGVVQWTWRWLMEEKIIWVCLNPCDYWANIHERLCCLRERCDQWSSACKVASQHPCKWQMKTLILCNPAWQRESNCPIVNASFDSGFAAKQGPTSLNPVF